MVRNLYLLRHGHAEHGYQMDDFDRELTNTGIANVNKVGVQLKDKGVRFDLMFCSTAKRTRMTADIILAHLGEDTAIEYLDEIYEASVKQLLEVIATADTNHENIMLVGHNPSISFVGDYLTSKGIIDLSPGQIAKLTFVDQEWSEITKRSGSISEI